VFADQPEHAQPENLHGFHHEGPNVLAWDPPERAKGLRYPRGKGGRSHKQKDARRNPENALVADAEHGLFPNLSDVCCAAEIVTRHSTAKGPQSYRQPSLWFPSPRHIRPQLLRTQNMLQSQRRMLQNKRCPRRAGRERRRSACGPDIGMVIRPKVALTPKSAPWE
jgi:hypothetical protein